MVFMSNQRQLENIINEVINILEEVPTRTMTEVNSLICAMSTDVAEELDLKLKI